MILPAQLIRRRCVQSSLITPFHERGVTYDYTYGLSACGYDIRIAESVNLLAGDFALASSIEHFNLPDDLQMDIKDKSSWARQGLAVQNTVAEPGWRGHLTLELTNHSRMVIIVRAGTPIAQVRFLLLAEPTEQPYRGRYQDQLAGPQPAIKARKGDE